jgi:hypothetical protein
MAGPILITGNGIYSADGNPATQRIRTIGNGDGLTLLTNGNASISQYGIQFDWPTSGFQIKNQTTDNYAYRSALDPGVTQDTSVLLPTYPMCGWWDAYILGAYYASGNTLTSYFSTRIRMNADTVVNFNTSVYTTTIRTQVRTETFQSDATNFPSATKALFVVASGEIFLRLIARTSAAVGSKTVYTAYIKSGQV